MTQYLTSGVPGDVEEMLFSEATVSFRLQKRHQVPLESL